MFGAVGIIVGPIIAALFLTVWELFGSAADRMVHEPTEGDS
jgi:predicted PurR-regulated permease PerM